LNHFADTVEAIDRATFVLINSTLRHALLDVFMPLITEKWNFVLPMALVVLYLLAKGGRRGRMIVLCAVLLVVCADASATALRSYFQRVRPCQALQGVRLLVGCSDSFSFPSGHATNAFALAAFFATYYRQRALLLFVMAALVGYSRIYVGVHYPADVLAGAVLGVAFGLAVGVSTRTLARRWFIHRVHREDSSLP
jgi:undecaprenyl-diphosphatase